MTGNMAKPTLCMIHEAIGYDNAIAKVSMRGVYAALDAGYDVTVVAKYLDKDLQKRVRWLRLFVPRRLFLLQWITARFFIKRALGRRKFDLIHAHQPQVASLSDLFQCHYITRMAYLRKSLETRSGLKPAIARLQERGVLLAEDYFYKHWNPNTRMLFDSELTRTDFAGIYGMPPRQEVLLYSAPPFEALSEAERREARAKYLGVDHAGPVLGFLGGSHGRKGYQRIVKGLQGENDVFFLMGGAQCDDLQIPELNGRFKAVGLVYDPRAFYAACDVVIMASLYEPFGLVALEAAACGAPVIATPEVGALPHLEEYGAGVRWDPDTPLAPVVHRILAQKETYIQGAKRMTEDLSEARYDERLMKIYAEALRAKGIAPPVSLMATTKERP